MQIYCHAYASRFLVFQIEQGSIIRIEFSNHEVQSTEMESKLVGEIALQFDQYFAGDRKQFCLPYKIVATDYQTKVLEQISRIPYGRTESYSEIARKTSNAKAARAIGSACNRNPLPIIIPCHRVLGISGSLTGYAGGLEMKKSLLDLERKYSRDL